MRRRDFLSVLTMAPAAAAARRKPNFVFILIDDYGWKDTGFNGSTFYETPHIDRLARSGMIFTDGYSASPVCSPTRAALMTGRYPARLHLTAHLQGASNRYHFTKVLPPNARLELPLEEITIAEALRQQGYRTACIGKWHLGAKGFLPAEQGFDVVAGGDEAGSTNSFFFPAWQKKVPLEGRAGDYLTDRLTDLAVEFIAQSKDRPFFLYLPHFAVHTPIEGKPEKVRKYAERARPGENPQHYDEYAAMIESVDESVGRVMAELEKHQLTENTVVIFTADNGGVSSREWKNRPVTSNLPLRAGKGHVYEGGIRVPTVVSWRSRIRAGSVCSDPVLTVDYAPTIAELAGAKLPPVDGRSIAKLLSGGSLPARDIFWHYPHYSPQLGRPAAAIRNGDYKLILFFEDQRVELYNLRHDLGEQQDLAAREPARAAAMRQRLESWLRTTKAQIPQPNPKHEPARELELGPPTGPVTAK